MEVSGRLPDLAAVRSGKTLPVFIEWMIAWAWDDKEFLDETTIVSQELLGLFCSRVAHVVAVLRLRSISYTTRHTKVVEKLPHLYGELNPFILVETIELSLETGDL
jgi:hypothetical protein